MIDIDQLANEIASELEDFSQEVVEKVNISSEKVGKEAVKKLKSYQFKQNTGYSKSWSMSTEKALGQPNARIIHAGKPYYRLTHLLENGHAKADGGRVEAIPHISVVEKEVIQEFVNEVEEAIKNG